MHAPPEASREPETAKGLQSLFPSGERCWKGWELTRSWKHPQPGPPGTPEPHPELAPPIPHGERGREALSPCPALLSPDPKPRHEPPGSGNLQVLDPSPFPGGKQRNHAAPELGRRHLQGREGKPSCPQRSGGFIFHSRQVGMVKGGNLALLVLPEGQGIKFQLGGWRAAGEASEMVVEVRKECSKGEK